MTDAETAALPDGRMNRIQPELYLSYSGGMNAFTRNHREMDGSTLQHLVNGTVRGGWVQTRPSFEWIPTTFESDDDQTIFETGKIQGSGYYQFDKTAVIVYAVDGNLFAFDPVSGEVHNINPDGVAPFSKYADFVYFQTRAGYLVSGDGIGRQVITKGFNSRHARPTDPHNEVPTGLMMADDWGRLAIVSPDRRQIRLSNHEMDPDPNYSPLGFDETFDYYLNTRYFEVPAHIGKIVWLGFLPLLNSDSGTGPLAVLGEHGLRYYDVSVDRTQWTVQDIAGTLLPNIGGIAHRAQVTRNDDLIFSDQHGRIRTLKQARRDEASLSMKRFDRPVFPYYETEPHDLRRWRLATDWNERVLVAIQPESKWLRNAGTSGADEDRFNVRHRGIAVWNGEVSEYSDERDYSVWDGLWTGIYPATLDTGLFGVSHTVENREMCIALSVDDDGINRPYAIREDGRNRYDVAPGCDGTAAIKSIEMQMVTRPFDFSARDTDYSLLLKRLDNGVIRVGERWGNTSITGYVQSDQDWHRRKWFTHNSSADQDLRFETPEGSCECTLTAGRPHHDPKLKLPSDQADGSDPVHCTKLQYFYKASIHLVITGWARIEEMMFNGTKQMEEKTENTVCGTPEKRRNTGCNANLWSYHARTADNATK